MSKEDEGLAQSRLMVSTSCPPKKEEYCSASTWVSVVLPAPLAPTIKAPFIIIIIADLYTNGIFKWIYSPVLFSGRKLRNINSSTHFPRWKTKELLEWSICHSGTSRLLRLLKEIYHRSNFTTRNSISTTCKMFFPRRRLGWSNWSSPFRNREEGRTKKSKTSWLKLQYSWQ